MPIAQTKTALTVLVDTREQLPYTFAGIKDRRGCPVRCQRATLTVGDYSIAGGSIGNGKDQQPRQLPIAIERKSKADLYGSLGRGRARLAREFERARDGGIQYLALVIESDLLGLRQPPSHCSGMNPTSVIRTLAAWSVRYNLHVWTPGPREAAERWTWRLLQFYGEQYHD
ncbi:MAG: ERCC4 domain-containing protein [Pseudomonadota bacterium]